MPKIDKELQIKLKKKMRMALQKNRGTLAKIFHWQVSSDCDETEKLGR